MINDPEFLFQNSRYPLEDILNLCHRVTNTNRLIRQTLSKPGYEDPHMRFVLIMSQGDLFRDNIDPCHKLTNQVTSIPELTVQKWMYHREKLGRIDIIPKGWRDLVLFKHPFPPEVINVIDGVLDGLNNPKTTKPHPLAFMQKLVA